MSSICLVCHVDSLASEAQILAHSLGLDFHRGDAIEPDANVRAHRRLQKKLLKGRTAVLLLDHEGLSLMAEPEGFPLIVRADFCDSTTQYRHNNGSNTREIIAKAVGLKSHSKPSVLDCTAGMGADAYVLAALGCELTLLERNPIVHALLKDAFARANKSENPKIIETIKRMRLVPPVQASLFMKQMAYGDRTSVVYLDPMFPPREKSARVKKGMQVFHSLVGKDLDSDELLPLAWDRASDRVVVKRPRYAQPMNNQKPSYTLEGQRNRYDIYLK
ncbi:MAG: Ribosomal RNA small subunit methyltransferase J [Opitutia bacterium UBA7350]|nr:MAG: Ribosomal RNA small subunit methyltransferase J [Opitutae bacterium UBA7350]